MISFYSHLLIAVCIKRAAHPGKLLSVDDAADRLSVRSGGSNVACLWPIAMNVIRLGQRVRA